MKKFHFEVEVDDDCYSKEENLNLFNMDKLGFCQFIAMLEMYN